MICDFLPLIFTLILKSTKITNILLILSQDEINFVQYYDEFCALKLLLFLTKIFRQRKTSTKLIRKIEISEVARIRKTREYE